MAVNDHLVAETIEHIKGMLPQYRAYYEQLNTLKTQLSVVQNKADFFKLVDAIVKFRTQLQGFLSREISNLDEQFAKSISNKIEANEELSFFSNLLHCDEIFSRSIINTKERISHKELIDSIPAKEEKEKAELFIVQVKNLENNARLNHEHALSFKRKLADAGLLEEVETLEREISAETDKLSGFRSKLSYPENEQTAGALINYFETNPEVLRILSSFDLKELLIDDILAAKVKLSRGMQSPRH